MFKLNFKIGDLVKLRISDSDDLCVVTKIISNSSIMIRDIGTDICTTIASPLLMKVDLDDVISNKSNINDGDIIEKDNQKYTVRLKKIIEPKYKMGDIVYCSLLTPNEKMVVIKSDIDNQTVKYVLGVNRRSFVDLVTYDEKYLESEPK